MTSRLAELDHSIENLGVPNPDGQRATLLTNYWYIAAKSSELRGRPLSTTILDQPIVLFRLQNGDPAALGDRCAHRNMPLSAGRVVGNAIECPYHGWQYGIDGTCQVVPSLNDAGKLSSFQLARPYPVMEQQGFVWVYMGTKEPDQVPFGFPNFGEPGWTSFTMKTTFFGSAFACLENFLDVPHTAHVHGGWFRSASAKEVVARVRRTQKSVEVEFIEEPKLESVVGKLFAPSQSRLVHTDRFFMPTTSRVDYYYGANRHFIITSQCTPVSDYETTVYTVITFRFASIGPLVRLLFEPVSRFIIQQDVRTVNRQAAQIRRFGGPQFTFVETDLVGRHIRALWRRAIDNNGLGPLEEWDGQVTIRF